NPDANHSGCWVAQKRDGDWLVTQIQLSGVLELIYPIGTDYFVISYDRTIEPYPPDPPRHARVSLAAVRWSEGGWAIDQNIGVAYSYEYGDEILVSPTGSRAFRCISQMDSRWYTWYCISCH